MRLVSCANCREKFDPSKEDRCPECGTHYQLRSRTKQADGQCAFNDYGARCERLGILSGTQQGDGPWYCREHAWVVLHDNRNKSRAYKGPDIQAEAAKFCAERGLDTVEKMRTWVKANSGKMGKLLITREPGQDDEELTSSKSPRDTGSKPMPRAGELTSSI